MLCLHSLEIWIKHQQWWLTAECRLERTSTKEQGQTGHQVWRATASLFCFYQLWTTLCPCDSVCTDFILVDKRNNKPPWLYSLLQTKCTWHFAGCLQFCDQTGANTLLDQSQNSLIRSNATYVVRDLLCRIFMKSEADFLFLFFFFLWSLWPLRPDSTLLMSCIHSEHSCWTVIDTGCSGINMNDSVQTSITSEKRAAASNGQAVCLYIQRAWWRVSSIKQMW